MTSDAGTDGPRGKAARQGCAGAVLGVALAVPATGATAKTASTKRMCQIRGGLAKRSCEPLSRTTTAQL